MWLLWWLLFARVWCDAKQTSLPPFPVLGPERHWHHAFQAVWYFGRRFLREFWISESILVAWISGGCVSFVWMVVSVSVPLCSSELFLIDFVGRVFTEGVMLIGVPALVSFNKCNGSEDTNLPNTLCVCAAVCSSSSCGFGSAAKSSCRFGSSFEISGPRRYLLLLSSSRAILLP